MGSICRRNENKRFTLTPQTVSNTMILVANLTTIAGVPIPNKQLTFTIINSDGTKTSRTLNTNNEGLATLENFYTKGTRVICEFGQNEVDPVYDGIKDEWDG
jgi:hypothetical protein